MNTSIKQVGDKLVYDVSSIMKQAHINAKSNAEYLKISYAEAFQKALLLEWAVAKLQMADTKLVNGEMMVSIKMPEKPLHSLRSSI